MKEMLLMLMAKEPVRTMGYKITLENELGRGESLVGAVIQKIDFIPENIRSGEQGTDVTIIAPVFGLHYVKSNVCIELDKYDPIAPTFKDKRILVAAYETEAFGTLSIVSNKPTTNLILSDSSFTVYINRDYDLSDKNHIDLNTMTLPDKV